MNRNRYVLWLIIYVGILSAFSYKAPLLFALLSIPFCAIIFSSIVGIYLIGDTFYHSTRDLLYYFNDIPEWVEIHRYDLIFKGKSNLQVIVESDLLLLGVALLIFIHLYISLKRCNYLGACKWWTLVPFYSPIALLFKNPITSIKKIIILIGIQLLVIAAIYGGIALMASNYK